MLVINLNLNKKANDNKVNINDYFSNVNKYVNESKEAAKKAKEAAKRAEIEAKKAAEIAWQNTPAQYAAITSTNNMLSYIDNETKIKHNIDLIIKRNDDGVENPYILYILHNDDIVLSIPLKYASFFASCIIDALEEIDDNDY